MAKSHKSRAKSRPPKASAPRAAAPTAPVATGELVEKQLDEISGGLQLDENALNFTKTERSLPTDQFHLVGTFADKK